MFYRSFSLLSTAARGSALPTPIIKDAGLPAEDAAAKALALALDDLPLSARLESPESYRAMQLDRRRALEALICVPPDEARLRRAVDLICLICEESRWSDNSSGAPFDDDAHPELDFQCVETAVLLGWTARALGEVLPARTTGKLLYEVRRRVFSPFLAHEDYPFMKGRGPRPLAMLSDILLSALLLELSDQRRASILKQALRQIDYAVGTHFDRSVPLSDAVVETGALADLAATLCAASRGKVDLRPTYPTQPWLDQLLYSWLEGPYFCDPAGGFLLPEISGAELFRIGQASDDDALSSLGGMLHRLRPIPSATVTGRLLDQQLGAALAAENRTPPRIRSAATPDSRVMVSRCNGITCALHTGGSRGNAGGMLLFCDGQPILVESGGLVNLPLIAGKGPLPRPSAPCEADFKPGADRDMLSVDLTHAWAPGLTQTCQRTAIIDRADGTVRLVDAFELSEAAVITFLFHTPAEPRSCPGGLRLGGLELTWDGDLTASVTDAPPLPGGAPLYRVALTTPAPAARSFHTFYFNRT